MVILPFYSSLTLALAHENDHVFNCHNAQEEFFCRNFCSIRMDFPVWSFSLSNWGSYAIPSHFRVVCRKTCANGYKAKDKWVDAVWHRDSQNDSSGFSSISARVAQRTPRHSPPPEGHARPFSLKLHWRFARFLSQLWLINLCNYSGIYWWSDWKFILRTGHLFCCIIWIKLRNIFRKRGGSTHGLMKALPAIPFSWVWRKESVLSISFLLKDKPEYFLPEAHLYQDNLETLLFDVEGNHHAWKSCKIILCQYCTSSTLHCDYIIHFSTVSYPMLSRYFHHSRILSWLEVQANLSPIWAAWWMRMNKSVSSPSTADSASQAALIDSSQ